MQAKAHLKLVTPTGKKRAVAPQRRGGARWYVFFHGGNKRFQLIED
jgi:hypothetical protein